MILSTVALAALLLIAGAPRWAALGVVVAGIVPMPVVVAVVPVAAVVATVRSRRRAASPPVSGFIRAIADDLAGGRTFVQAVSASDDPSVDHRIRRLCSVGVDGATIAAALADRLGGHAGAVRAAVALSEQSGGSLAGALHGIADRARLDEAAARERRVAVSQARFSAIVVGVAPLVIALAVVIARGIPEPGGAPTIVPMVTGAVLMIGGSTAVAWMSRPRRGT